jgi:presenilin-like A22 family membrane protease
MAPIGVAQGGNSIRARLFLFELVLFVGTLALGIFTASRLMAITDPGIVLRPAVLTFRDGLLFAAIFLGLSILLTRVRWFARVLFRLMLIMGGPIDTIAALFVVGALAVRRSVLTHNIAIMLGIAGAGAVIGLSISPNTAMLVLILLSIYDILAVYVTGHMVSLARQMIDSGAVFGFVIPAHPRGFRTSAREARPGSDFMILGSGDIGVPLLLAASTVPWSLGVAALVGAGAIAGLAVTFGLFVFQRDRRPMAALPPIATGALIGYLLGFFIL